MSGPWADWESSLLDDDNVIYVDRSERPSEQEAAAEAWLWFEDLGGLDECREDGITLVSLYGEPRTVPLCDEHEWCDRDAPCRVPREVWALDFRQEAPR